ncbi:MAG: YgeY family selenium metabolism-linked hydrolase [Candidatus Delongbacteria bacterium]
MRDTDNLMELADASREAIVGFLREMIAIPAESCREEARCRRVKAEYEALGFDEVHFDGLGSVIARVGNGPLHLLFDGHIDCVGVGDAASWSHDPFQGKREDGKVWGRGAVDELPAIACMAHGMAALKRAGWPEGVTVWLCASVMEEDCDGLPLQHLIEQEGLKPHAVILGEPTDMAIYRGHRGRMEISVTTRGVAAHGAHCERGVNAIYKMAPILQDIEVLNATLAADDFLGKGTVTVSYIDCRTPSLCAVPDQARIWIDRRLTKGETVEGALEQIRTLPHIGDAAVELPTYDAVSWRGLAVKQPKSFPTWVLEESHPLVQGAVEAVQAELGAVPRVSRWTFSTNGVASMGRLGIPTIGFAPGKEELSHSTGEWVSEDDLVKAAAVYARLAVVLAARKNELM